MDWRTAGWVVILIAVVLVFIGIIAMIVSKNLNAGWLIGVGILLLIVGIIILWYVYKTWVPPYLCDALKTRNDRGDRDSIFEIVTPTKVSPITQQIPRPETM